MKKLFYLLLTIVLIVSSDTQVQANVLTIKGHIVNYYHADIHVSVNTVDGWVETEIYRHVKNFKLSLDPHEEYRIVFTTDAIEKQLYIQADNDEYTLYLDIDFTNQESTVANLYPYNKYSKEERALAIQ